jgi:tRNA threonylcarbamoyladenosine biosynthesis protein TsaE
VTETGTEVLETSGEQETIAAGERLGRALSKSAVLLLYGELGAGKTAFVRGLAKGLGASPDDVSSPTFTLIQEYRRAARDGEYRGPSGPVLYHVDLYRLSAAEIDDLGLDELIDGAAVVAIEWADRWPGRPADAIEVRIEDEGGDRRRIHIALG